MLHANVHPIEQISPTNDSILCISQLQFSFVYTAVLSVVVLVSNGLAQVFQCFCEQAQAHESKAGAIISVGHSVLRFLDSGLHLQLLALPGIKRASPFLKEHKHLQCIHLVISFGRLDVRYTFPMIHLVTYTILFFVLLRSRHNEFRTVENLEICWLSRCNAEPHSFYASTLHVLFMLTAVLLQQATPATMHRHPPGQGQGCWPHPHALEIPQLV